MTLAATSLLLSVCTPHVLGGQIPGVGAGAKVRITAPSVTPKRIVAVIHEVRADTFIVKIAGRVEHPFVATSSIERLEVSRGQVRPRWSRTAPTWMPLVGAATLGLTAYVTTPDDDFFGPDVSAAIGAGLGAILGLLVGIPTAIAVQHDQWDPVFDAATRSATPTVPALYAAPNGRGFRIGLRSAF